MIITKKRYKAVLMKILVFSDSHSHPKYIEEAIKIHGGVCDLVIFLGDGIRDVDYVKAKYPSIPFFSVKGNCDMLFSSEYPNYSVIDLEGVRVLITHGHVFGVKGGLERLANATKELGAKYAFFGHTHIPTDTAIEIDGETIHIFNPGSISYGGTYGVVNTSRGVLVLSHGKI